MLYGFTMVIFNGSIVTLELALSSLAMAIFIGLIGASAKLSGSRFFVTTSDAYTTLIRGVPDLVLMLLIFYGLQILINDVTDMFGFEQIDLNPLVAGILTLGYIWRIFHGNVPRRLAICAEGTNRSRYCIWIQQSQNLSAHHIPCHDALCNSWYWQ